MKFKSLLLAGSVVLATASAAQACTIGGAFDHRVVDGYHLAVLAKELRSLLEDEIDEL